MAAPNVAATPPATIEAGPFGAVVDATDPNQSGPTRLADAINMYVPDPTNGSAVLARHGFQGQQQQLGGTLVGTTLFREGQGMLLHRRLDGTTDRFVWAGGRMYVWDGKATFTDVTPAGVDISPTNPVFAVTFSDRVVISDETNKPWVYNPYNGVGTVIEYNAAGEEWCTKGGPVVFGGRVFFIVKTVGSAGLLTEDLIDTVTTELDEPIVTESLAGVQTTIAWSRALDPLLGYQQLNDDNAWTLTQSSADLLAGLFADEAALVYFRNTGIGFITGTVNTDFRTSSTVDAIDTTIGTDAPAALVVVNRRAWFVDLDGQVHRVAAGGKPELLWYPMRRAATARAGTSANRQNVRQYARGAYHPTLKLVLFTIWDRSTVYAFDALTGSYVGTWSIADGIAITAMGAMVDASNRSVFLVLGSRTATDVSSNHGVVWRQKFPDDPKPWLDQRDASVAAHVAFPREVETQWLSHKVASYFRGVLAMASLVGDAIGHAIGLRYTVPPSGASKLLVTKSSKVVGEKSGTDTIASAAWSLGRNAQGSAIRLRYSAESSDDVQFGLNDIALDVQVLKARPRAK